MIMDNGFQNPVRKRPKGISIIPRITRIALSPLLTDLPTFRKDYVRFISITIGSLSVKELVLYQLL